LAFDLHINSAEQGGTVNFMGRATIKVIKKNSPAHQPASTEGENVPRFSKRSIHTIEDNIKGWIEELEVRKNNELIQAHSFLGG